MEGLTFPRGNHHQSLKQTMKKIILPILAVFLFTACSAGPESDTATVSGPQIAELDSDVIVLAVRNETPELCTTIEDPAAKSICDTKVSDQINLKKAVEAVDPDICKQIQESSTKERCNILVNLSLEDQQKAELAIKEDQARQQTAQKAYDQNDVELCESIRDDNQRLNCRYDVITKMVGTNGDKGLCKEIGNKELEALCAQ